MIFVNFKNYKEAVAKNALELAKLIKKISLSQGVKIIPVPSFMDIPLIKEKLGISCWAQHVDPKKLGKSTGWLPAQLLKEYAVEGSFLNHSEKPVSLAILKEAIALSKRVGLKIMVFVSTVKEAEIVSLFKPDFICYEPPEFISSKTLSVATAKREVIAKVVKKVKRIPVIVGAGIKTKEDVRISLAQGAKGVVVSSAIVLAKDKEEILIDLCKGFKRE